MKLGMLRRVLVVCPLSVMRSAWQEDFFKFAIHRSVDIAYGTAEKRKKIIDGVAEVIIINFDGIGIVKKEIIKNNFDLIVVDEASAYKNAQTDRWKNLRDIVQVAKGLWMLTGTPAAQSPVDAYGLAKLINPTNTPKFFGQFRDMVMDKTSMYRWTPKVGADKIVHRVLQPAIRFEKHQCLDLPPLTYIDRDAPLTSQQKAYYTMLKKQMMIQANDEDVTAVNAAVQINKLLQIAGGAVYTDSKEVLEFDVSNRLNVVKEVIEESSNKTLVFVPFTHTIQILEQFLTKHGISNKIISGDVPVNKRSDIVREFQNKPDPRVLILQPMAASHGLTLTAADTIIWYSPIPSVETYLQANARIDRPGQKNNMTVVHITGSPVEDRLYKLLRSNMQQHAKIIDLYKQEIQAA